MLASSIQLQALWLLLVTLTLGQQQVAATPLTQYTCACPVYTSSSSSSSSSVSSALKSTSTSTSISTSASSSLSKSTSTSTSASAKSTSAVISSSSAVKSSTTSASSASSAISSSKSTSSSISSSKASSSTGISTSSSSSKSTSTSVSATPKSSTSSSASTSKASTSTSASTSSSASKSSSIPSSSSSKIASSSISSSASKSSTSSSVVSTATSKAATSSSSSSKAASSSSGSSSKATSTSISSSTTSHATTTTSSSTSSKITSTSTSASASATSGIPTTDSSGYHAFPTLSPNSAITAASYTRLTSLLPTALKNAISISTHSWELGTLANSLTEVYYPYLSPYSYDSSSLPSARRRAVPDGWGNETHREMKRDASDMRKRATASPPWSVLDVITKSLSSYSWSGAPSTTSTTDTKLADYLSSSTSPVSLPSTALIDGDGALGDPCALGAGAWIAAEYFQQSTVQSVYANGRKGVDYAWAVGGQYAHLESGTRSSNGTLSQREGYFETWADMGYMIPPFVAYVGMATNSETMLNDALSQWCLEVSSLLNYNTMLFLHIPDWDQNPWATGNGWMLEGFTRVVASIYSAGQSGTFWSVIDPYESTVAGVFTAIFNQLNSANLVPNYMLNTGDSTGDSSGTAIITAAYYRFRALAPWRVNSWMDTKASAMFDAVVGKVGSDGWLTQVVNPEWDNGWNVYSGQSPEGQSFLGLMWAARTAAGV